MTDAELIEANEIKEKICKIKEFLFYGERTWTGQLIKQIPLITVIDISRMPSIEDILIFH